jgi:hypothetical protein
LHHGAKVCIIVDGVLHGQGLSLEKLPIRAFL